MSEHDADLPDPDDEVISGGGLPRWLMAVGALLAVAFVVTVLQRSSIGHHRAVAPPPSRPPSPSAVRQNVAFDLAAARDGTWLLETSTLAQVSGTRVTRSVALRGLNVPSSSVPNLAVDAAANRVWVVLTNAAPTRMLEFDATTLRRVRAVTLAQLVQHAVAFDGYLYLSTDFGIAELAPGTTRLRYVPGLAGAIGPIIADPERHRVIAIDLGYPTDVWTFRPRHLPDEAAQPVTIEHGSLAVVGNAIWLGGDYESGRAVLLRLDPRTLRPVQRAPAGEFGPEAVIVGAGAHVIWVRSAGPGNELACVSATTGRVEQRWRISDVNAVTSHGSGALVATASGVLGLVLSNCAG